MQLLHGMQLAQIDIGKEWQLSGSPGKGGFSSLGDLVTRLLPMALVVGGVIFFLMVIVSGFSILAGAGSEDAAQKAKWHQVLTYGAVGLIIMFGAFWVLQIINFMTGNSLKGLL